MNILFPKKQKKIIDAFFEFSFEGKEPKSEDFKLLNTSSSMHFLADIYNWDDGEEVLDWIISNPKCDKGTALLIFWRAEPDDYTCFSNEKEADDEKGIFLMLKKIIDNFETGFYKRERICFDPEEEGYDLDYKDEDAKWAIPDFMKKRTKGIKVIYFPDLVKLIKTWWVNYREMKKRQKNRKKRRKRLGLK